MIIKNPLDNVMPPAQIQPEIKVMSINEQKQFIEALEGEHYRLAFLVTIHTGLRLGEVLALRWMDIDFDKKILTVRCSVRRVAGKLLIQEPKSKNSRRNIPLLKNILNELTTLKGGIDDPNGIVFKNPYGFITEPRYFTEQFKRILKKADLSHKYNFHSLRHAFATRLIEAGENAKIVADLLGHSNVSFTLNTYAHALPEKKHSAIEKLSKIFEGEDEKNDDF
jgi:integrase